MRLLEFQVNKQLISKSPTCDFNCITAGTSGYLRAKFTFSSEDWDGCRKAARFWGSDKKEYSVLLVDDCCEIPSEVLTSRVFSVAVMGRKGTYTITTNKAHVRQEVH